MYHDKIADWKISTVSGCTFDNDAATSHTLRIRCDDGDDTVTGQFNVYITPNAVSIIYNLQRLCSFLLRLFSKKFI